MPRFARCPYTDLAVHVRGGSSRRFGLGLVVDLDEALARGDTVAAALGEYAARFLALRAPDDRDAGATTATTDTTSLPAGPAHTE